MTASKNIAVFLSLLASIGFTYAQVASDSELFKSLKAKDSLLFDAAFNTCDIATLESLFTEDFEFYHDKGGATTGRSNFLDPLAANCSKRNPENPQQAKRILIANSLEVYPMYNKGELYGAIQHGIHRFEFLNDQKEYQKGDTAKFTHVWIKEEDMWKIKRELSYNHKSP